MAGRRLNPVIYLDMDGVCADFVTAAVEANGASMDEMRRLWTGDHAGEFHMHKLIGATLDGFWAKIDERGDAFWSELVEFEWFPDLYRSLREIAPVVFLSSPSYSPMSLSGKLVWLQQRFGRTFRDFILTGHKQQLACRGAILIDDYDKNVDAFRRAGGEAILFPQLWNSNHALSDPVAYTLNEVAKWRKGLR
ncbi:MAG: hypothetical protein O3A46_14430 [Candidatus Poribacteria bacterium]|nr:hypothetical protein [Candidatus Poribacteria bacterium]